MINSVVETMVDKNSLTAGLTLLDEIPPLDMAVQRLIEALSNDDITDRELAGIIDACPSLSGKIVGLANSAYFRRSKPIHSLQEAIALIGMRTVKSFAIASALQEPFSNIDCPAFEPGRFWLQLVITAQVARELSKKVSASFVLHPEEAYLAGLLHNMGLLALAHLFPAQLNKVLQDTQQDPALLVVSTEQVFGVSYLAVGAALLKHWHLPERFITATRYYSNPGYDGVDWTLSRLVGVSHEWALEILQQSSNISQHQNGLRQLGIPVIEAERVRQKCLEQIDTYLELSEIISGAKVEFGNSPAVAEAALDLKDRLTDSVMSLSAVQALSNLNIQDKGETEILDEALKILIEHQDMQRCSIFLNKESSLINVSGISWEEHFSSELGNSSKSITSHTFTLGEGIIGLVAKTGEMKHTRNCSLEPLFKAIENDLGYIPGSLICVPIRFQDTVLGVLNISHSKADAFTEWHERFLIVFSNMLGQLIMFNRTIQDMDTQINQRTMELQSALARAESLSTRDELTGIHNRRYFISHFNKFIQQCERYKCNMAVLMIDIDDFKSINDTYGHIEGDLTLIKVAKTLTQCARNADIVARLGGEEFIFAVQHSSCEDVKEIADRVLEKIRHLDCGEKRAYKITASIGISCSDDISEIAGKDIEKWMHEADQALYQAKHSGKDCVVIFDKE